MHRNRSTLILLLTAGALTLTAAAHAGVAKGTIEFSPTVAFNRSTSTAPNNGPTFSLTHLNFDMSAGYFLTPQWQLGGGLLFQYASATGAGNSRNGYGANAGTTFNFTPQGSVMPYLSASIGAIQYSYNGESDKALLAPMIRAGFRTMMWEGRSVNVSFGYQHETNNSSSYEESSNKFDVGVGMSLFRAPNNSSTASNTSNTSNTTTTTTTTETQTANTNDK